MSQFAQLPLPLFQALLNKVAERPYGEVVQLVAAVQAQLKIVGPAPAPAPEDPAAPAPPAEA